MSDKTYNNQEMEIKGQLLSSYLKQKDWAVYLNNAGKSYDACKILETLANDLILDDFDKVDAALEILKKLRKLGATYMESLIEADPTARHELRINYMNNMGRRYFFSLSRALNKIMKEEKFYQIILKGLKPRTKKDNTLGRLLED